MSTGQVLLTIGSIVLLAIVSIGVQQLFVQSVTETVGAQHSADAINYGRDISERIYSYAFRYNQLETDWGNYDDVTDEDRRLTFQSQVGQTFHATVDLSDEKELAHGQYGRTAEITIYEEINGEFELKATYVTSVVNLSN